METKLFASINDVKSVDDKDRIIEFTATKEIRDYDNDIVKIDGLDINKIKKNKSFLWSHQMAMPPVGKITKIWKSGDIVKGQAQMTSEKEYEFGYTIYKLIKGGYINNVSMSFIPDYKSIEYKEEKDGTSTRVINKSTMLEVSAVNIGANNATSIQAKSFKDNINKAWDDGILDGSELLELEALLEKDKEGLFEPAKKAIESPSEAHTEDTDKEAIQTYKKNLDEAEIKIAELELQLSEQKMEEEIEENDLYSQLFDEFVTEPKKQKEDIVEDTLAILKEDK
jgi:HK97 family phage prohead protease